MRIFPHGGEEAVVADCEDPKPTNLRTHEDVLFLMEYPHDKLLPSFNPADLIGATYLTDETENGQIHRAKIVKAIQERDATGKAAALKFLVTIGEEEYDCIVTYNDICDIMEKQREADETGELEYHAYRGIVGQDGP